LRAAKLPNSVTLPIDSVLGEVLSALETERFAVLEAPPGAGKTTRVPYALARSGSDRREVIVTEPRRLAARLAADFVARETGGRVGGFVGYSVRFDEKRSAATRVCYVTEGVLLRRLVQEPELPSVRAVVLDEFHERHVETDQLFALLVRLAKRRRDFRLLLMSATLDGEAIARHLGGCPRIRSEGRQYPLELSYDTELEDRPLEKRVSLAVKKALGAGTGNVLVFLPGAREIALASAQLETTLSGQSVDVLPLHGELPLHEQARAVEAGSRRKVVLATNVAETSVTVNGVDTVVDAGLARVASFSPWTGRRTLSLEEVSQQSCIQRAGRAGRTGPGRAIRLYAEGNFKRRPVAPLPEILRADLTDVVLGLLAQGISPSELEWLDAPPKPALGVALQLLHRLGITTAESSKELTPIGRRVFGIPLPARLARVIVEGERLGVARSATLAACLLSEPDIRERPRSGEEDASGSSDLQHRIDLYRMAEWDEFAPHALRSLGLRARAVKDVQALVARLNRTLPDDTAEDDDAGETALRRALLAGFPDCVARRQAPGSEQLILHNGTRARLARESVVREGHLLLVLDAEARGGTAQGTGGSQAIAHWVSALDPNWLLDDYADWVDATESYFWNAEKRRVESVSRLSYGSVTIEEQRTKAKPSADAGKVLFEALSGELLRGEAWTALGLRVKLLVENGIPLSGLASAEDLLREVCSNCVSEEELEAFDLVAACLDQLPSTERETLRREAPEQVALPGGRKVTVHYEPGQPPWVASRLQDFFGMKSTPTICRGRVPLVLHLLAPNQRAVQVTSDLSSFWQRHYPELRKQLCRRYPRHSWPEDGATATPPEPRPPRR
jgi:ATP-dependent helicase HrpB